MQWAYEWQFFAHNHMTSAFVSGNEWERRSSTFSSQNLFISLFYMEFTWIMQYQCDNALQNLKCVPEPFS